MLKEWVDRGMKYAQLDLTCAGRANGLLVTPDDPGKRPMLLWDRNGDGKADVRFYLDRSNRPEYSEWDGDFDGVFEYRAAHEDGEWEPKSKTRVASR